MDWPEPLSDEQRPRRKHGPKQKRHEHDWHEDDAVPARGATRKHGKHVRLPLDEWGEVAEQIDDRISHKLREWSDL